MPKQSKSTKTDAPVAPAVATETKPKVPKEKKEPKQKAQKAPEPEPEPVAETPVVKTETPAVETEAVAETDDLAAQTAEFLAKINQLGSVFTTLKAEFRALEKKWTREIKTAQKSQAKRKRKTGNRQPSGFVKPTKISEELAAFLGKESGSEMARTDVTREINKYIRSHNLQDKENGRKINPDAKLKTLLKLGKTDELTYFNLQRYMSPHFFKAEKPTA